MILNVPMPSVSVFESLGKGEERNHMDPHGYVVSPFTAIEMTRDSRLESGNYAFRPANNICAFFQSNFGSAEEAG